MCGRFALFGSGRFGYDALHLKKMPAFERYNIAPSQDVLAIRLDSASNQSECVLFHWGLVPFWSKVPRTKFPLINARCEQLNTMPSFRGPFRHRRCIIPASGFYIWQKFKATKRPYFVRARDREYLAFAGIWDFWRGEEGAFFHSCAIITTEANAAIRNINDRMPALLAPEDLAVWLDPMADEDQLLHLLRPFPEDVIEMYPVSLSANNPRNDGPECIAKAEPPEPQGGWGIDRPKMIDLRLCRRFSAGKHLPHPRSRWDSSRSKTMTS